MVLINITRLASTNYPAELVIRNILGKLFQKRFQEHLNDFNNKYGKSKFAQHLINNKHAMGPIEDVMKVLHTVNKGGIMNTLENFHIYKETKVDNQMIGEQ